VPRKRIRPKNHSKKREGRGAARDYKNAASQEHRKKMEET